MIIYWNKQNTAHNEAVELIQNDAQQKQIN